MAEMFQNPLDDCGLLDADTDTNDEDLRRTPEAELQGSHRLARSQTFFRVAKAKAKAPGVDFNWRIRMAPGAEHSNAQMTPAAAELLMAADQVLRSPVETAARISSLRKTQSSPSNN